MSATSRTGPKRSPDDLARHRAELILKVRAGLMTATAAAAELGVSRKTYYEWERRGLHAMLQALEDRPTGRPAKRIDGEKETLKRRVVDLEKDLAIRDRTIELRDRLREMAQADGASDAPGPTRCRRTAGSGRKKKKKRKGSRPKR